MQNWQRMAARGRRELAHHNPEAALKWLEGALNACPIEMRSDLSQILYYLGVTLAKLGRANSALRAFGSAARLRKRGSHSRALLKRMANEYGMERQRTREGDDWNAFYAVQLRRYLKAKHSQRIVSCAERDMIHDLIGEYWSRLAASGLLAGKCAEEKLKIFRAVEIVFPFYIVPDDIEGKVVRVNFATKSRVGGADRCVCGSGLPYMVCCGRTASAEELLPGTI